MMKIDSIRLRCVNRVTEVLNLIWPESPDTNILLKYGSNLRN